MAAFAEYWQTSPSEVLRLPISRRRRLLRWKERHAALVAQQVRSKSDSGATHFTNDDIRYIWGEHLFEE